MGDGRMSMQEYIQVTGKPMGLDQQKSQNMRLDINKVVVQNDDYGFKPVKMLNINENNKKPPTLS